ncbi:hypothetical protein ACHAWO_006173 [Cyclotella atomus]|uniref:Transmembrane protein n=1 Tax=Cyclotella atomus TaxID=382360 RepID=A0ABD3PC60_9STRA
MASMAHGVAAAGARHKLNAAGEDFLEPLLANTKAFDSDDDSEESEESVEFEKQGPIAKLKTTAIYGILCAGVAVSVLAFVLAPQTLTFVAGAICVANTDITGLNNTSRPCQTFASALRSLNNKLRRDANRLSDEVDALSDEVDALKPEAERAKEVEENLNGITAAQNINVDRLVELVRENGVIIEAMKDNLRKRVVQDIIKIVIDSDKDNDMRISKVESKMMLLKIRIQLQEYGVDFDEAKFYKVLSVNPCVSRIISLIRKLVPNLEFESERPSDDESTVDEESDIQAVAEMFTWANDDTVTSDGSRRVSIMAPTRPSFSPKIGASSRKVRG